MAKKYLTKSKPAAKQAPKKYQFAGANSSTYNQVANPYYVSGTYAEQAGQEADRYYNQAGMFGDYASESNDRARLISTEREQAKKDAIAEVELQKKQEGQAYGQELAKAAGNEALSVGKKELAKRAAKKAAEKTATDALTTAGSTAASAVTNAATNTIAQGIAPALTTQAARGSGMEAARLAGNMFDEAGNLVLPQAANTGAGVGNVVANAGNVITSAVPGQVASQMVTQGTQSAGMQGLAAINNITSAAKPGLMAANMAGLASAGIGLGLTGAGMLVQRKMDTDPTKFDRKEGRQNMFGDALKSASKGFTVGATAGSLIPGVGNVVAGTLGAVGMFGAGLVKGKKENKESKKYANEYAAEEARLASEEAKRKAILEKQGSLAAQQYNTAFVNSRLSGLQTGFGYNTSTNMNMQPTSSFYGKTGGVNVPGGQVVPIEGSDAVEFVGRKHSEGGIALGPKTEVEGGETMGPVAMNEAKTGGKMSDYFFSAYLKLNGKSFAQRHKELIKSGASQAAIQDLAKKQETVANKKGEKDRGPEQIASYGGIHKYQTGDFLVAGPTGKPVYKPISAMTEEEYNAYMRGNDDEERAVAPNLPFVKDSGEKTTYENPRATYDFGSTAEPTKTNRFKETGPYGSSQKTAAKTAGPPVKPTRNLPEGYEWKEVAIDGNMEWSAEPIQPASLGAKVNRSATPGTEWREGKMPDGSSVLVNTPTNKFKLNGDVKSKVTIKEDVQRIPSRRPGPDSTAGEQIDSKGANTPTKSANAQSNSNARNVTIRDQNKANAKAPSNQQSVARGSKGGTTSAGQNAANTASATNSNTTGTGSSATGTSASNTPITGTAGFAEGRRAVTKDEYGESTSLKGVPKGQTAGSKFYGNVTDQQYADMVASNPWYDFTNFNPANKTQVAEFQRAYNGKVRTGEKLKEDGKFGQQTVTARVSVADLKDIPYKGLAPIKKADINITKDTGIPKSDSESEKEIADVRKGVNGSLLAGLGQLIPVGYALARPYKTDSTLPRMQGAGNVGSTSVRGAILPRINMNAERAASERNTVAVKNAIQNTNAGPGGIAAMLAANSAQNEQSLTIANQEQRANRELAGEEARLGMQASMSNAEMAQRANMANVQNNLAINQANLEAGIKEKTLKIDEKRYKREEILGALDTASARIAGIVKDEKSYKAQERLAEAIDNTGSYDRFTIYEQLKKESQKKSSPYYGKTDVELRKISSDTFNEVLGKMGMEGEGTARTGGRRYTTRLGELSKGKKTFNI